MTKTERELLNKLAGAYYFILGIRADAIKRRDGYYTDQTNGIEATIEWMEKNHPQFKKYFNLARKKAKASVQQQTEATEAKGPARRETSKKPKQEV